MRDTNLFILMFDYTCAYIIVNKYKNGTIEETNNKKKKKICV